MALTEAAVESTVGPGRPKAAPQQAMWVELISSPDQWADHAEAWAALAAEAIEPNVFYEPWMLLPAIPRIGAGRNLRLALVFSPYPTDHHAPPTLCGVFPLEITSRYTGLRHGIPVSTLSLWRHKYCYSCTPLIRNERAAETLEAFFSWLDAGSHGCTLMQFKDITVDGPFHHLLTDFFHKTSKLTFVSDCHTRALFRRAADADTYLRTTLSGRRRKDLRRQSRQLASAGQVEYDVLKPDGNPTAWIKEFLDLEAESWKGKEGYALTASAEDREYFEAIATGAFDRGRLMMLALRLNGRRIACKCNFLAGPGSFAFSIAFDEAYARYSPGKLLEVENIRLAHERPGLEWMDSCAVPFHVMINLMWSDRRTIQTVVVSTGRWAGDLITSALPMLKWLKRTLRRRKIA